MTDRIANAFRLSDETEQFYSRLNAALLELDADELGVEIAPDSMSLRELWIANRQRRQEGRPQLVRASRIPELKRLQEAGKEHNEHMQRLNTDPNYVLQCWARTVREVNEGCDNSRYRGD